MKDYIGLADTAKMVRKALAKSFPGVKFYVRSKSYSGGSSIDIYYDGLARYVEPVGFGGRMVAVYKAGMPKKSDVEAVVSVFAGHGFDGMIDMGFLIDAVVDDSGNVIGTASTGTVGSMGSVPAWGEDLVGTRVRFGAGFVFVNDTLPYGVGKAA